MTDFAIRHFADEEAVARVGEDFLARTLPKTDWTHEAHLATTTYLTLRHPEIDLDAALPGLIRDYNESVGGVNDDTQGYHDTITRAYLHGVRLFIGQTDRAAALHTIVNALLRSPIGRRGWPLHFWSKERLMSSEARRSFVEPDIKAMPRSKETKPWI